MSPRRDSSTDVNGEAEQPDDTAVEGVCVCLCGAYFKPDVFKVLAHFSPELRLTKLWAADL